MRGKGPVPLQTGATRIVIGRIQSLEHVEKPKAAGREFSYVFWVPSGLRWRPRVLPVLEPPMPR